RELPFMRGCQSCVRSPRRLSVGRYSRTHTPAWLDGQAHTNTHAISDELQGIPSSLLGTAHDVPRAPGDLSHTPRNPRLGRPRRRRPLAKHATRGYISGVSRISGRTGQYQLGNDRGPKRLPVRSVLCAMCNVAVLITAALRQRPRSLSRSSPAESRVFHSPGGILKIRRFSVAGAVLASAALALSACTTPAPEGDTPTTTEPTASESATEGEPTGDASTVTVGWNQPFYSYNSSSSHGNATANAIILYMTQAGFNYYDADLNLAKDESFGTYEKLSDDPLTVKYTINEGVVWSDGAPVDAADMLLYWGAVSGNLSDEVEVDEETGEEIVKEDQVYFTSGTPGLALVTQ